MFATARSTAASSCRLRATAPASVLCAKAGRPSLRATGNPISAAAAAASLGATKRPGGNLRPCSAKRCMHSHSSRRRASAGSGARSGNANSAAVLCRPRSEEHTSELQSPCNLVCRLLLEKQQKLIIFFVFRKKKKQKKKT